MNLDPQASSLFLRNLAQLLGLGLPLGEAVERLQAPDAAVCRSLADRLKSGSSLAKAMEQVGRPFDSRLVRAVAAAEAGENLLAALAELARMQEGLDRKRRELKAAMTHPRVLAICSGGLLLFMALYILPTFVTLFEGMSLRLPWPTQLLVFFTKALNNPAVLVPMLVVLSPLVALAVWLTGESSPVWIGGWLRSAEMGDWLRWLGFMVERGVPLAEAARLAAHGGHLASRLRRAAAQMEKGATMESALSSVSGLPGLGVWVALAAERREFPAGFLARGADALGREAELGFARSSQLVEPLAACGVGLFVGFVVLSVFLPLYQLIGTLG